MAERLWQSFFDAHAPFYLQNCFAQNTEFECDFLVNELKLEPGMRILDIGCGAGRHSVGLAKRGLTVTGIDLSEGMLTEARKLAKQEGVEARFVQADALTTRFSSEFDAAICLCEGALGLIEPDEDAYEHDLGVLACAASALASGKPFLCTALNGYKNIRMSSQADVETGKFDPVTMRFQQDETIQVMEGHKHVDYIERMFIPPEMILLLKQSGFWVQHVWGGTASAWNKQPLNLDEMEAMYVCVKR